MADTRARVNAPEFPDGLDWLNTSHPITMKSLRGKVVLLDFWTFCCINCMHVIPDLKKLEKKYPQELVVIGVHSAKFENEKLTANIRQAILRYEIEHPVVNDKDMQVWQLWGVHAWPTLFLVDPEGKVVGYTSGEGIYEAFDQAISKIIEESETRGLLKRSPLSFDLEKNRKLPTQEGESNRSLSFPGKVFIDPNRKYLFISDSNHNRILVCHPEGKVLHSIGQGVAGFQDGSFTEAQFDHPQGMAWDGKNLYVADTENHAIRQVALESKMVSTLAGTGKQAQQFNVSGKGTAVALNSPWDLVVDAGSLYIAMAGSHQLWKMDLQNKDVTSFAGSGREARIDGPLRSAALAQPSGITTDGIKLYFADSEISSIRACDLKPDGKVETLVGEDLFEFGDRDGIGTTVRLQHPLGITFAGGILYVADTYNNKLKKIHPLTRECTTLFGSGAEGLRDGREPLFDEPAGVSVAGDNVYIADTNNHLIRIANLVTREVRTLPIVFDIDSGKTPQ